MLLRYLSQHRNIDEIMDTKFTEFTEFTGPPLSVALGEFGRANGAGTGRSQSPPPKKLFQTADLLFQHIK